MTLSLPNPHFKLETFNQQLNTLLDDFQSVSLTELKGHSLINRVDSKFLLSKNQLLALLPELERHFKVLELAGKQVQLYENLYFDTPEFSFYTMHHNGNRNRYKVRERFYPVTGERFLEIKHKSSKALTSKYRVSLKDFPGQQEDFLIQHIPVDFMPLEPQLYNQYQRISLVSKDYSKRLSLDFGLVFSKPDRQNQQALEHLVIAELKQTGLAKRSSFEEVGRSFGLKRLSFSKYCAGCALLYQALKINRFKPVLQFVRKVEDGDV